MPVNSKDLKDRNWDRLDIILVSGDAYVDHPSWAAAILGRFLEHHGYRVGIIPQPNWRSTDDFKVLGKPRLFWGVGAGNLDTMVSHYTADKKKRRGDLYSPGGKGGYRPDRASIVYTNRLREAFPGVPVIIGGIEASLRRLVHYDYWDNHLRRSLIMDSKADLLVYGMGEYTLLQIADRLQKGENISDITNIPGTAYVSSHPATGARQLPSYKDLLTSKLAFSEYTRELSNNLNPWSSSFLSQQHGDRWVNVNPPPLPLTTKELDLIYELPFKRDYHPMYRPMGGIPALIPVQFSLTTHRGCFGGCHFCSIGFHQGKFIQSRSIASLKKEAESFLLHPDFKGIIPDLGGASANMFGLSGKSTDKCKRCQRISCLYPAACKNLNTDHSPSVRLWRNMRSIKGLKNIRVASGVRYDLIQQDTSRKYLHDLCRYHIGGQLKIAPEHVSSTVTGLMGKPGRKAYEDFIDSFKNINKKLGKKQYLIPYFISAHPGSTITETIELAEFVRDNLQYYPEQVQNFTPTPMTISTSMYYTGINPINGRSVYVPGSESERKFQRALLQYRNPDNREQVLAALRQGGRDDLIGSSRKALVKEPLVPPGPARPKSKHFPKVKANKNKVRD